MKRLSLILMGYLLSFGCRSSYDEKRSKVEIESRDGTSSAGPILESPEAPASSPTPASALPASGGSVRASTDSDPLALVSSHDATSEELKKYNCKGTAVITDSGTDKNKDGILQDEEIRETRIDCTELVPGSPAKP